MNIRYVQPEKNNSTHPFNLVGKLNNVNTTFWELCRYSRTFLLSLSLVAGFVTPAQAEDANAKAIVNSTELLNLLDGVVPEAVPRLLENLQNGQIKRVTPNNPVWILNSDTGNLLYYQGQKHFVGQSANRLVDDKGFRFGQRALDMAKKSHSTWIHLELGGQTYSAYCGSKAPFVVCTLIRQK